MTKAKTTTLVAHDSQGRPVFKGTGIPVRMVIDDLNTGLTVDAVLAKYPQIDRGFLRGTAISHWLDLIGNQFPELQGEIDRTKHRKTSGFGNIP